jgi:hypothetical protein
MTIEKVCRKKSYILIERIQRRNGVSFAIWTLNTVGVSTEMRGSVVPKTLLERRKLGEIIDWVLAKHGRAQRRSQACRAAQDKNSARQIVHDLIVLHKAEKKHKEA